MSGFDASWLDMREPFDAKARDAELAQRFVAALGTADEKPKRIVDLAAGSGASFRALAPLLEGDQHWLLVDHDPSLIAEQREAIARWALRNGWRCDKSDGGVRVRTESGVWVARAQALDLARDLDAIDIAACDGVTTSAFLDLVSAAWLDRLCDVLMQSGAPLLATLTVDGRREWRPALPADASIDRAFAAHQSGDKGFGPAKAGLATAYLADRLAARGYEVATARSDWRIRPEDRGMLSRMVEETAEVAIEAEPGLRALFSEWSAERREQIRSGLLSVEIGHLDLFAQKRREARVNGSSG